MAVTVATGEPALRLVASSLVNNSGVRRETGRRQEVQVLRDEGVATHIGPEPCVPAREGRGEASAGVCVGQPSSGDSNTVRSAEGSYSRSWGMRREAAYPR